MTARFFSSEPLNLKRMSPGVKNLVLANVAVFVLSSIVGGEFVRLFGLVPRQVLQERWVWQPVTYMFVHGGFLHLFFNVFMLWMFGMAIEAQWGTREFLKYYFICGLSVALVKVAVWPQSGIPLIGASGALFGLLVAFAMLYPDSVVYLYFFLPVKASHMAILCGLIEFFSMLGQGGGRVDHFAHLTGLGVGYLYIRWWWAFKLRVKSAFSDLASGPVAKSRRPPRQRAEPAPKPAAASMEDVDRILDKILAKGLDSLTEEEREIMRRYSDRMKH
ncbi:MAG: rhomboid family intramembrane serine protease [Elusimicrobia bacterium]|nr:rhomboid family intramembrane serine protease [Elusimicrobiota bacterium]